MYPGKAGLPACRAERSSAVSSASQPTLARREAPAGGPQFRAGLLWAHPDIVQNVDRSLHHLVADRDLYHVDAWFEQTASNGAEATAAAASTARDERHAG